MIPCFPLSRNGRVLSRRRHILIRGRGIAPNRSVPRYIVLGILLGSPSQSLRPRGYRRHKILAFLNGIRKFLNIVFNFSNRKRRFLDSSVLPSLLTPQNLFHLLRHGPALFRGSLGGLATPCGCSADCSDCPATPWGCSATADGCRAAFICSTRARVASIAASSSAWFWISLRALAAPCLESFLTRSIILNGSSGLTAARTRSSTR